MRTRPSASPRVPGIYEASESDAVPAIAASDTRIAGFVGLSERGPIGLPTRVQSWDDFVDTYGNSTSGFLSGCVYSFFQNGGPACWVVRVAHCAAPDVPPTMEHAACASITCVDAWGKPAFQIVASSEGSWGNEIFFQLRPTLGAEALLTRDVDLGAGEAFVSSTRGFSVGDLVRVFDREHEDFVVLTSVGDHVLRWDSRTPLHRKHHAAAPTTVQVHSFELQLSLRGKRELFRGLQLDPASKHFAPAVVAAGSRFARLRTIETTTPPPHCLPRPCDVTRLEGGRNGDAALTPEDVLGFDHGPADRSGLAALLATDEPAQIAVPDAMLFCVREPGPLGDQKAQRVQDHLIASCENLRDKFAVLDIPLGKDIEHVRRWRRRVDSSFAAFYWPWLVSDSPWGQLTLPPSATMCGVFASRESDGVHVAPANVPLASIVDVSLNVTEDHLAILSADGINGFRIQRGVRPWGGRTASSDASWRYISVRRLFIMLRRSLESGYAWAAFEPNNEKTWGFVQERTRAFLRDLHRKGMFAPGDADAVFYVKCDEETNPPESVQSGRMICEVGIAPVVPAEFITLSMNQEMNGPA